MTTTSRWTLDDIPWDRFNRSLVTADLVKVAKAAALVEYNAHDYATYMSNVFHDDPEFQDAAKAWAVEEVQHGEALARWAMMADPDFDFDRAVTRFRGQYRINLDAEASTRGSRAGELVARCMVEIGTSSYYTALSDGTDEPVLKAICQRIAADEHRHYKLFYTHLKTYLQGEKINPFRRLRIALGRLVETEDDELACAYYAANAPADALYVRAEYSREYMSRAYSYYRHRHIDRAVAMMFKACGLRPQSLLFRLSQGFAWLMFRFRAHRLQRAIA
jgi:rubrerythrin